MHVTVVGAGALGRAYGVRLAADGSSVDFVVRSSRLSETGAFVIEQVNGSRRRDEIASPSRRADVPPAADAVLVTVRFDQIDERLAGVLRDGSAPIVFLTPLMPAQRERMRAVLGARLVPGMPGVSGYVDDRGVVRYWVVSVASTLVDDSGDVPMRQRLENLARTLTKAGLPARLEKDVASLNAATTTAFYPLVAAIDLGGGIDSVLADKQLLALGLDAAKQADALAQKIGKVAPWASLLTRYVNSFTLKPGVALAKRLFPESVRFVDAHFGPKLHAQHLAMGEAILELGQKYGVPVPAVEAIVERLRSR